MLPALAKLVCLASCIVSFYLSFTPPTSAPISTDNVYKGQLFDRIIRRLSIGSKVCCPPNRSPLRSGKTLTIYKTFACTMLFFEMLVTAAVAFPSQVPDKMLFHTLCSRNTPQDYIISLSPSFLAGVILMTSSAQTRLWCFRTLGNMFTFEVSIRAKHELITGGPYAFARHPSYTAAWVNLASWFIIHFSDGSWVRQCNIMRTYGGPLVIIYFFLVVFSIVSMARRGPVEDAKLQKEFGKRWDEYAKRVPYRFVPGVY
jgi:protein-S-isoprenylcysteine O-methyltransferase Ste14